MPKQTTKYKKKRLQNRLLLTAIILLTLFFFVALLRIGVGEAEWAGMTVSNFSSNYSVEYNIPEEEKGVVINWVEDEAYYSDVKEGDLLKAINGKPVDSVKGFLRVAKSVDLDNGALLDILRDRQPMYLTLTNERHGLHGQIKEFFNMTGGETGSSAYNQNTNMTQVALKAPIPAAGGHLPTPTEQGAAKKILVEGHWLGLELIPITPELAREYRIPPNTKGLLVDEISLESAQSGILAGDMLVAVEGYATPNLVAFTEATRRVKNRKKAKMLVSRRGKLLKLTMRSDRMLGFSQNEAAQPILPGAISPHKDRGRPCTACHIIMKTGGQLPTDAGDILPNPPPIVKGAVAPHRYRGECKMCHIILKK